MNPDEIEILQKTKALAQENNKLLRKLQKSARRMAIWGFIKLLIIVVPIVVGFIYVQPYLDSITDSLNAAFDILNAT